MLSFHVFSSPLGHFSLPDSSVSGVYPTKRYQRLHVCGKYEPHVSEELPGMLRCYRSIPLKALVKPDSAIAYDFFASACDVRWGSSQTLKGYFAMSSHEVERYTLAFARTSYRHWTGVRRVKTTPVRVYITSVRAQCIIRVRARTLLRSIDRHCGRGGSLGECSPVRLLTCLRRGDGLPMFFGSIVEVMVTGKDSKQTQCRTSTAGADRGERVV